MCSLPNNGTIIMLTGILSGVQKAGEDGIGTGFRTYGQDPRQERQGPSLPSPQQRPVEGWREDSQGARWQGSPAEVSSAYTNVTLCCCCKNLSMSLKLCSLDRDRACVIEGHASSSRA